MISIEQIRPNFARVYVGDLVVWFSYRTPIAFRLVGVHDTPIVRVNEWGPTTGKHLNAIDSGNKKDRISGNLFTSELDRIIAEGGAN